MTPLRQRMLQDMGIRNLAENTQLSYLQQVSLYAGHFHCSPEELGPEQVRDGSGERPCRPLPGTSRRERRIDPTCKSPYTAAGAGASMIIGATRTMARFSPSSSMNADTNTSHPENS